MIRLKFFSIVSKEIFVAGFLLSMFGVLVAIGILFAVVKVLDKLDGK